MGNQQSIPPHLYEEMKAVRGPSTKVEFPNMPPRELFGLDKNFTLTDLKNSYKRLVLLVHPDKGGSEAIFQHVTECFRVLYMELQQREDRGHAELKAASLAAAAAASTPPPPRTAGTAGTTGTTGTVRFEEGNGKFSNAAFNTFFDNNKFEDPETEFGYAEQMAASSKSREDIAIPRVMKKFSNKVFESKVVPTGTAVAVYEEPEPLVLAKKLQFTEIGKKPGDFETETTGKKGIQYMDYMRAHTTTRLVDPRSVKERGDFKSVDQFEAHRERATAVLYSNEELERQRQREEERKRAEEERLQRLQQLDQLQMSHHARISHLIGR